MRASVGSTPPGQPDPPGVSRWARWRSSNHHRTMYPIPTNSSTSPSQLTEPYLIMEYSVHDSPTAPTRMPLRISDQTTRRRLATACWYEVAAADALATPAEPPAPASGMTPDATLSTAWALGTTPCSASLSRASFCMRVFRNLYQTMPMSRMIGVRNIDPTTRNTRPTIHGAVFTASLNDSKSRSESSRMTALCRLLRLLPLSASSSSAVLASTCTEGGIGVTLIRVSLPGAGGGFAAGAGGAANTIAIANAMKAARAAASGQVRTAVVPCIGNSLNVAMQLRCARTAAG